MKRKHTLVLTITMSHACTTKEVVREVDYLIKASQTPMNQRRITNWTIKNGDRVFAALAHGRTFRERIVGLFR